MCDWTHVQISAPEERGTVAAMRPVMFALVAGVLALMPPPAFAESNAEVRDTLRELDLDPPMLYPNALPSRLGDADVTLSTDAGIAVVWDRGQVSDSDNNRVGYIGLYRAHRKHLRQDLRTARSRGYPPRRVRLRGRPVWRLCGHVCGYAWDERGRYYGVYGIYYIGDEDGRTVSRDQRRIIRKMRPLR